MRAKHPSYVVDCPTCELPAGKACRTVNGRYRAPHPDRIRVSTGEAPRSRTRECPCGGGELHHLCGKAVHR